jgi:hypothetical protein
LKFRLKPINQTFSKRLKSTLEKLFNRSRKNNSTNLDLEDGKWRLLETSTHQKQKMLLNSSLLASSAKSRISLIPASCRKKLAITRRESLTVLKSWPAFWSLDKANMRQNPSKDPWALVGRKITKR